MMSRQVTLLLAASLLVNVFAFGAIGGGLFMLWQQGGLRAHPIARQPLRAAGDDLPAPDRARFRVAIRTVLRDSRDLPATARDSRAAAAALFVQPTFDSAAVLAALDRARAADFELRRRLETAAVQVAATLPADERVFLARGLARGGPLRHPARRAIAAPASAPAPR
ncbi:periplasmic heavy metal sensor [Lichenicoccus sp.]|uniref:periplasmic heavy metal sensor n=1 Tax=Lichenicoccus sp. TaxID=2781899 RepID=UPI003D097C98